MTSMKPWVVETTVVETLVVETLVVETLGVLQFFFPMFVSLTAVRMPEHHL